MSRIEYRGKSCPNPSFGEEESPPPIASTVTVSALSSNFAAALALAATVTIHPSFPAEELDREREAAHAAGPVAQKKERRRSENLDPEIEA